MKVAIAGAGYVGLSNAVLLAQHNSVVLLEPNEAKVEKINNHISPIADADISSYLRKESLQLVATTDTQFAYSHADYVLIATPTNYDTKVGKFDTSTVEQVIATVRQFSKDAVIVIKSTIPIGFTAGISRTLGDDKIFFSPEFLREGRALHDCLYPSRIIVGFSDAYPDQETAQKIVDLLGEGTVGDKPASLIMGSTEAEAVKLFANTYLAMRVSFFNEIDSYAEVKGLNTQSIIEGIGLDPRIGTDYNNPSFGYGGYCLPKDSKQLLANFEDIPQELISAVVSSNETRKNHIVSRVLQREPKVVGIYRLTMKSNSDNFRESSVQDIMRKLLTQDVEVVIYEPILLQPTYAGCAVLTDLQTFVEKSDVIIANRLDDKILPYRDKVYTRDLYMKN